MFLTAIGTVGAFVKGFATLSFFWMLVGMIHFYFLIVLYSLYDLLKSDSDQKECLQNSGGQRSYSQCSDPERDGGNSYQASE